VGVGAPPSPSDLEPRELLRYAAGKATDDERTALEDFVKRSRWAYDRVVTLVRSNRPNETGLRNQVARRLLGDTKTKAARIVGLAILEVEGITSSLENASIEAIWKTVEKSGSPKTRAACLIGMGRHEDARKLLDAAANDASCNLLRRVSTALLESDEAAADDAALLAVLDMLPSL
jgi:hypothetical protein